MAYDSKLCSLVLGLFVNEVHKSYRRRAKTALGLQSVRQAQSGFVTFIQRFSSNLALNPHFHTVALDGVYVRDDSNRPVFFALDPPTDEEVADLVDRIARRIEAALENAGHGELDEGAHYDALADDEPLLARCAAMSLANRHAWGANALEPLTRLGDPTKARVEPPLARSRCANVRGFNLEANVRVRAHQRKGLEKLFRYVARPAVANDRWVEIDENHVAYKLKRPWSDGTTAVLFSHLELVAKLVPLIARPRDNQTRYHGISAPCTTNVSNLVLPRRIQAAASTSLFVLAA